MAATSRAKITPKLSAPAAKADDKEEYVKIPATSKVGDVLKNRILGKATSKASSRGRLNPIRTVVWYSGTSSSSAAAAQAPVVAIEPGLSAEFSSFAALFDEYKVFAGKLHWKLTTSNAGQYYDAGVAYDPEDSTAYGGLLTLLPASQRQGPIASGADGNNGNPVSITRHGLWEFPFHCPREPQRVPDSADVSSRLNTGQWSSTAITDADYGYLKWYINAPAAGSTTLTYYVELDVEFRSRT